MQPAKAKWKQFRKSPKYPHHRSEGMTRRRNSGSKYQGVRGRQRKERDQ